MHVYKCKLSVQSCTKHHSVKLTLILVSHLAVLWQFLLG